MEVVEFINRRFEVNSHFCDKNCYYFAVILLSRFPDGKIYYDVLNGHFIFYYQELFYDWTGIVKQTRYFIEWNKFDEYDSLQKERIINDCIL